MLLLSLMLACGSKTMETVTTGEASPVTTDASPTETTAGTNTDKTTTALSSPTTGKSVNSTKSGTGTASTSATVSFVTPAKTTVEYDEPETEEIPMDDHTEENPEE